MVHENIDDSSHFVQPAKAKSRLSNAHFKRWIYIWIQNSLGRYQVMCFVHLYVSLVMSSSDKYTPWLFFVFVLTYHFRDVLSFARIYFGNSRIRQLAADRIRLECFEQKAILQKANKIFWGYT